MVKNPSAKTLRSPRFIKILGLVCRVVKLVKNNSFSLMGIEPTSFYIHRVPLNYGTMYIPTYLKIIYKQISLNRYVCLHFIYGRCKFTSMSVYLEVMAYFTI